VVLRLSKDHRIELVFGRLEVFLRGIWRFECEQCRATRLRHAQGFPAIPANPLLVVKSQDLEAAVRAIILKFSLLRFDTLWFLIAFVSPLRLLRTWS
jgi:hypothetical protein